MYSYEIFKCMTILFFAYYILYNIQKIKNTIFFLQTMTRLVVVR